MFGQETCSCPVARVTVSSLLEISGPKSHAISAAFLSDLTHMQLQGLVYLALYFLLLPPGHLLSIPSLQAFVRILSAESSGIDGRAVRTLVAPGLQGQWVWPVSAPHHLLWLLHMAGLVAQSPKRGESICPSKVHRNIPWPNSGPQQGPDPFLTPLCGRKTDAMISASLSSPPSSSSL